MPIVEDAYTYPALWQSLTYIHIKIQSVSESVNSIININTIRTTYSDKSTTKEIRLPVHVSQSYQIRMAYSWVVSSLQSVSEAHYFLYYWFPMKLLSPWSGDEHDIIIQMFDFITFRLAVVQSSIKGMINYTCTCIAVSRPDLPCYICRQNSFLYRNTWLTLCML